MNTHIIEILNHANSYNGVMKSLGEDDIMFMQNIHTSIRSIIYDTACGKVICCKC